MLPAPTCGRSSATTENGPKRTGRVARGRKPPFLSATRTTTWPEFGVIRSARPSPVTSARLMPRFDVAQSNGVRVRRDVDAESRVVPAFEAPFGDPEEQRNMVRLVVCDREVGKPVLVEIRDGQVHRILAGGAGPRHFEVAVTLAGQHEDALAAGNHEVEAPVAIQIASLDRGGRQTPPSPPIQLLAGRPGGTTCINSTLNRCLVAQLIPNLRELALDVFRHLADFGCDPGLLSHFPIKRGREREQMVGGR